MAVLPMFVTSNYITNVLVNCMVFSIFGLSWNIIGGYGAQISWCSAAFVAIGAYVNFIFSNDFGISPFITLPISMVLSLVLSTLIGYGTFRLQGAYFSIATIAFAETLRSIITYSDFTKGAAGMYSTYRGHDFWSLSFANDAPFYYIMLVLLFLTLVFTYRFTVSKTGWYLSCIKGDEIAAGSLGIETFKVKLRAFQISAMMMSVAGCFYASFLSYISPVSTCSFDLSIKIGVVAIIGGIGTLWGPVVGAFIIIPLIEVAASLLGASGSSNVLYGLMLVLIVMFRPAGVFPLLRNLFYKLVNRNQKQVKGA
ncbi:MAG TPA: branched-chain amino acid ABC transporter permease [Candidatus Pullichristensenella stercorigallinarum]|uniref:Branched-chain amino acid ABC transporter permease n=1 Tax=Candidatus Pullichristensenella stercorigallinarum TaxID=2840909 RepID=A0A9D0ZP53_9FIRM|nr:branched-chain amino acid ABC transporter permease [Candidatus Pullichristensenella stercorigallinarum]